MVATGYFDCTDNEQVFAREEFMAAFVPARDFIENPASDKTVKDRTKCRKRCEGFGAVPPRVDYLHERTGPLSRRCRITLRSTWRYKWHRSQEVHKVAEVHGGTSGTAHRRCTRWPKYMEVQVAPLTGGAQ